MRNTSTTAAMPSVVCWSGPRSMRVWLPEPWKKRVSSLTGGELNRQIKTDNALLRELRGQVKKLAQAVKNTIPALAAAMENLRKICCCSAIS